KGKENHLRMDAQQRAAQGVVTARAEKRRLTDAVSAPGEVVVNAYRSAQVTPRISAQIVERHAIMGNLVKKGQSLVTLSGVEMADAQGQLMVADREWQRVKKLGRKVVSERRYVEAQVARQQAYAKVLAYGMTVDQITALLQHDDVSKATGRFTLISPQDGLVRSDDFVMGEIVKPGHTLYEIVDESRLWVEAKVSAATAHRISLGNTALVSPDGSQWLQAKVIQFHHRLDETTRTLGVRLDVENPGDDLHPGEFVNVSIQTDSAQAVLAVPKEAIVLMQGSPTVFKLVGTELQPQPVETGVARGNYIEIKAGLNEDAEIAVKGAFLLKSLALKSQIGDHD
ncbi:Probable Co/Zn/Cd efflux system membrane fusion protein, partial [hydrothermal vent metagenome]